VIVGWTGPLNNLRAERVQSAATGEFAPEFRSRVEQLYFKGSTEYAQKVVPVWLANSVDRPQRWLNYAKQAIWPILHYNTTQLAPLDGYIEAEWWNDYVAFNEAYADKILETYRPGDLVVVHDYHLLLLPQILRARFAASIVVGSNNITTNNSVDNNIDDDRLDSKYSSEKFHIGFYMHSPFPSSECFRCLGRRKELLEGVLGANVVVTQSYAFSRHFISSCARLLGLETQPKYVTAFGMHVTVDTIPIGINVAQLEQTVFDSKSGLADQIDSRVQEYRTGPYKNKKIIFGRERLDSGRGVLQKLYAFDMFLKLYPNWQDKVMLVQVTLPPRFDTVGMASRNSELDLIEQKVSEINGRYGRTLVEHFTSPLDDVSYYAFLKCADLGLITCERDGLNTAVLEYITCQRDNHSPLILSEFTGTASTLIDATQVNPANPTSIAHAVNEHLTSAADSEVKRRVAEKLLATVRTNSVQHWTVRFTTRLVTNLEQHDQTHITPLLSRSLFAARYSQAQGPRVFLFDYDGTLTPIVQDPAAALPSARLKKTLRALAADPRNVVWIVSGRDAEFLDKHLGDIPNVRFSAEHGCFVKAPETCAVWQNLTEAVDMSWQPKVKEVFNYYEDRTQGSSTEVKKAAMTWHYRRADPEFGAVQARECYAHLLAKIAPLHNVEIMEGKANIEVRPREFNKGEIVRGIVERTRPEFVTCLGDDVTDEDMFNALAAVFANSETRNSSTNGNAKFPAAARANCRDAEETGVQDGLFTIKVGPADKPTNAAWHLSDPEAVIDTLALLVEQ
jgi:trehalose 6-phosphate synthase/phosphatase